ncbi:MAG: phenylalanine--tRNA ligase subunit alpha, partial [Actinomycetales bacterium]
MTLNVPDVPDVPDVADVTGSVKSALLAINEAKDLAGLKIVKTEHLGDKSALSKASQALGKL